MAELDADAVLHHLLDVARTQTGAAYAAIGVLDERKEELERFVTAGIDEAGRQAIGALPRGHGVLGVLIEEPHALRLQDVGAHPRSYGFPAAHPPMRTFLGVPISIRGEVWGNLYLTEKAGGRPFTADDEEVVELLAASAAVAIDNARLYRNESERRKALERANRVLETTTELSRALGGVTDVDQTLELVAKRSRSLLDARIAELAVLDGDEFVLRAVAGARGRVAIGSRLPVEGSIARAALRTGRTQRYDEIPAGTYARDALSAQRAIATPLVFRGRPLGVLVVLDRLEGGGPFTADDARLLEAFAATAATALATAQSATDEALRRSIEASETERRRWARELHDETLQELAGLRVLLTGARRSGDPDQLAAAVDEATDMIAMGIANLRALITDVRPAALDDLGVAAALAALIGRLRSASGLDVELEVDLAYERGDAASRLDAEVETTIYRLVQEALTNVVKHAGAEHVAVTVVEREDIVDITVRDDGRGFDAHAAPAGFGLIGIRERLAVVRGSIRIDSTPGSGTHLHARIPVLTGAPAAALHPSS
jgi:signal transduction histidine kinase